MTVRLATPELAWVPAVPPGYDRSTPPRIVHLGVGAFARAHLGVYADDLLAAGWPAMIRGVSLRSRTAEEQLGPQDGLYSVLEREPGEHASLRVIGSLGSVATGTEAAVEAIASPHTSLVTLTVTEKGYEPGGAAAAAIAAGLALRSAGAPPLVVASLDNVAGNGGRLRARVLDEFDPAVGRRVADEVRFPCSVVDRMVPATTPADLAEVERKLGVVDRAAVVAERHRSWVIEATDGLPPLADVGVQVVADVEPYERRKLWLLNGPHSALAYGGLLAGCTTIAEAVVHPTLSAFVRRLVDEVLEVIDLPAATQPRAFADEALVRFANPALGHTCAQVGTDGSQKLRQRLLPVVARRGEHGLDTDRFALVVAAWLAAVAGRPVHGGALLRLDDPAGGADVDGLLAALGADRVFSAEVIAALERLAREGAAVLEDPEVTAVLGGAEQLLDDDAVTRFVEEQVATLDLDGRSLCLVIPDATRACPLPLLLGAVHRAVRDRVRSCVAVVALGTHAAMGEDEMRALVGVEGLAVVNHEWWSDDTFVPVGRLEADDVARLSGGHLAQGQGVDVRVNRLVVDSDVTLIVGPVLPHEVVGFSGGDKYLFPGLSGPELIDLTHWVGALITSHEIIGTLGTTPVRALVEAAAAMVPGERHCLCVVGDRDHEGLRCLTFGTPRGAWEAAADVAAQTHVVHLDEPVQRVVSLVAPRYADLWTGAKGFYKVEPIVADGGEVILYAPHITEIGSTHPRMVDIGYHCRDFFVSQWDRFRQYPWGELAHSTHLFGAGTYNPFDGEHQRVTVTLATGIPEETVRRVNLNYLDPASIDLDTLAADPDTLVVPDAGEVLYRLK